jgi:hypothetical protein
MMTTQIYYIPLKDTSSPKYYDPTYIYFADEMREQFKMNHPNITYNQLPKFAYSMDGRLPLVEKEKWEAHAAADKRWYLELAAYISPPGSQDYKNLLHTYGEDLGVLKGKTV